MEHHVVQIWINLHTSWIHYEQTLTCIDNNCITHWLIHAQRTRWWTRGAAAAANTTMACAGWWWVGGRILCIIAEAGDLGLIIVMAHLSWLLDTSIAGGPDMVQLQPQDVQLIWRNRAAFRTKHTLWIQPPKSVLSSTSDAIDLLFDCFDLYKL